jgi:hypothetical protein
MQSAGQTSTQALHRVHDQVSMTYSKPFFKMAFSGQISLQLSQEIQSVLISKYGIIC